MEKDGLFENKIEIEVDYDTKVMIVPREMKTIGVEGDADTRRIYYRVKKTPQSIDFSTYIWTVKYQNALDEVGEQVLEDVRAEGEDLTMSFLIPATLCKKGGTVYLGLCASDADQKKHWHVGTTKHKIAFFVSGKRITKDDPKYDILDQLLKAVYGDKITLADLAGVKDGVSPIVTMTPAENGFTLTVTDEEGEKSHFIRDGENLHYEDLTDAQKLEIKGDPFTFDDFTAEQLAQLKGEPFRYEDFTQEQLLALRGEDGVSPTASITKTGDTATVEITDRDGLHSTTLKDGVSPSIAVSKAGRTTTVTCTDKDGEKTFDILDGITPTAKVVKTGDTATITINDDASGTTTASIKDGYNPTITSSKSGSKTTITMTDINGVKTAELFDAVMSFDDLTQEQKDSLKGSDGISPTITSSRNGKTTTLTITDKTGDHTVDIQDGVDGVPGKDGTNGISPVVSAVKSGAKTTLTIQNAEGDPTTVEINDGEDGTNGEEGATFTPHISNNTLSWTNNKGLANPDPVNVKGDPGTPGTPGSKGDDGVSPTATVTKSGNTSTLTVTDVNGTTTANIQDGVYKGITRRTMTSSNTEVTLNPNEVYVFPTMTSLTIALGASTSMADEYHFFFTSGSTATTLALPSTVSLPDGFEIKANKKYEISISENLLLYQGWT